MAGETGSGKTTQIPKLCLELGRGVRGTIAHTQPRRLAARTVAERIADELKVPLGGAVGFAVRFSDRSSEDTLVRLMTDGLLLAEIHRDPLLRRYDTVIVDEAHERSLNIDFLLGYLARILPKRPDLKVIITSATIDPERFAQHFGGAPVVEVSGRTYPVEVRYQPVEEDEDVVDAIGDAVRASCCASAAATCSCSSPASARSATPPRRCAAGCRTRVELLPLYARLSTAEQQRVFKPHTKRRVVLATNVAETSLTVPGIRYVVDPGTARISRYSARLKVQRLPIEPISQASADQRKGRCGRTSDGVAIRLYDEEDFEAAPALHRPGDPAHEPRRGDPADGRARARRHRGLPVPGPARPPPDPRRHPAAAGARRDRRAGASSRRPAAGSRSCRSTRGMGRMILEAGRARLRRRGDPDRRRAVDPGSARAPGRAARAGRPAARALRRRDVRLPRLPQPLALPARAAARAVGQPVPQALQGRVPALPARARVAGPRGRAAALGQGARDRAQPAARRAGRRPPRAAQPACSRTSASRTPRAASTSARAARASRSSPAPALARKPPAWAMVAELVETSRLWGRDAARIDPKWVEPLAEHLVSRTYSEPRWVASRALGRGDGAGHALRAADRHRPHGRSTGGSTRCSRASCSSAARSSRASGRPGTTFCAANQALLEEVDALEQRARRRDLRVERRGAVRLLRRADPARRRLRRALRPLVARRPPRRPRPAHVHARAARRRRRRRRAARGGRRSGSRASSCCRSPTASSPAPSTTA